MNTPSAQKEGARYSPHICLDLVPLSMAYCVVYFSLVHVQLQTHLYREYDFSNLSRMEGGTSRKKKQTKRTLNFLNDGRRVTSPPFC